MILNILLKDKDTAKNRIARFLYKRALRSNSVEFTVTSKGYGEWLNKRLGLNKHYYLLHDIYHNNYKIKERVTTQKNSVFCGGRNGRDWSFLLDIAKCMPSTQFNCVMSKEDYEKHAASFGKNVNANYDISQDEFIRMLSESELVIMPLDTDAPAGLIAIFQAAANNKMIIASNTMTTREYLGKGRGCLCRKNVDEWVKKIEYYSENPEKARTCASEFKAFLENECSEKNYAEVLAQIIK